MPLVWAIPSTYSPTLPRVMSAIPAFTSRAIWAAPIPSTARKSRSIRPLTSLSPAARAVYSVMLDVWVVHPLRSGETGGQPDGPADLFHVPSPDPPGPPHRFAPHHNVLAGVLQ